MYALRIGILVIRHSNDAFILTFDLYLLIMVIDDGGVGGDRDMYA